MHRITNQAVSQDDNGVTARTYVDAIVMGPDNRTGVQAIGFYDDELARTDDGWKIARRTFTMVLVRDEVDVRHSVSPWTTSKPSSS